MTGFAFREVPPEPDHPALEHRVLERWERERTFERLRELREGGPRFSFFDGPITANNPMGVHHAWGRSLKDLFQRYQASLGKELRYQNGFDCQGLWVEVEVEKALGLNSKRDIETYGLERFVRACRDRVAEYSGVQTEQSDALGMWMDWERSYFTMTDPNISYIWGFLQECHRRGWLYRGHRPMIWCARCGTSLSQHEVTATDSYRDVVHTVPDVRFRLLDAADEHLLVWTTTPWTLPANVAAAVNPYGRPTRGSRRTWALHRRGRSRRGALRRAREDRRAPSRAPSSSAGRYATGFDELPAQEGVEHRVIPGTTSRSTRARASSTSPPAAVPRTTSSASATACPCSLPSTTPARSTTTTAGCTACTPHEATERIVDHLGQHGWLFPRGALSASLPGLLALRHRADLPRRGRVVHLVRRGAPADDRGQPRASSGRRRTTASAWRTGSATWGTGASPASATGGCRCPSTCAPRAISRSSGARRSCSSAPRPGSRAWRSCTGRGSTPCDPLRRVRRRVPSACPRWATAGSTPASSRSRRSATARRRPSPRASPRARARA